jgi:EmrB/QacA subfamily drug resistance transporter
MFSLAVFIPLSGWAADRYGARNVFRAAIVIFTLGSIACGLSVDLFTLVGSRILQGMGGAMMVPVGRLLVLRTIPKSKLVDAMAWVTAPAMIGPVLGPPIGGLIVTYLSWRWIFFVNVPIGIIGIYLASRYIKDIRGRDREPLDLLGFALLALALTGLVFGFETVGRHLVSNAVVIGLLVMGVTCIALYLFHVRGISHPIIDPGLLKYPSYRASVIGGSFFRLGVGALPFLLPLMLQYGFGLTPAASGFLTFAAAAGAMLMKIVATQIIRTFGFRLILNSNSILNFVFLTGIAFFTPTTPHSVIFIFLLIGGFFRSLQFTALNTVAYAEIPESLLSRANTLYNMMQQLSLSMGVALGAFLLDLTLIWHKHATLGPQDFWPAYVGVGVLTAVSLISFLPMPEDAGAEISGHASPTVATTTRTETTAHKDPA